MASTSKIESNYEFDDSKAVRPSIIHIICLNQTLRVLTVLLVTCLIPPVTVYLLYFSRELEFDLKPSQTFGTCSHYPIYRVPCGLENVTESKCMEISCCYTKKSRCYHFLPSQYQFLSNESMQRTRRFKAKWLQDTFLYPMKSISPLNTTMVNCLKMFVHHVDTDRLTVHLWNPNKVFRNFSTAIKENSLYEYSIYSPEMFLEIRRKSNNKTVLSTARGPLIASEKYFEWSIYLNAKLLLGVDETILQEGVKLLISNEQTSPIPYIVGYDKESHTYHAIKLKTLSGPVELEVLNSNLTIIRSLSSDNFELDLFLGPTMPDIYRQIKTSVDKSYQPPFWGLGIHICKTDAIYNETETLQEINQLLTNQKIPFDSHCINDKLTQLILSNDEFSEWANNYQDVLQSMKAQNKKLLLHLMLSLEVNDANNPEIEIFKDAQVQNLLIKNSNDDLLVGIAGQNRKVVYLNVLDKFFENKALLEKYWSRVTSHNPDGIFLKSNFLQDDTVKKTFDYLDDFKFLPKNFKSAISNVVPLNSKLSHGELIHYINDYNAAQIDVVNELLKTGTTSLILSSSYREQSNTGMLIKSFENTWRSFKKIVQKTVYYSMVGLSFQGPSICGDSQDRIAEDLCIRWYQFAAFTPLFHVKSDRIPSKFSGNAQRFMINSIKMRYQLLEYINSNMISGQPLLAPLYYRSPTFGRYAEDLNDQFLFGNKLLITPVLYPQVTELEIYFPEKYFELWSGLEMPVEENINFAVVMSDAPIFIREGSIVALRVDNNSLSALEVRMQPLYLIVAFNCTARFQCWAQGTLMMSKNFSIVFEANEKIMSIKINATMDDKDLMCGDQKTASIEISHAKVYGLGAFSEKFKDTDLIMGVDLCTEAWDYKITINL